MFVYLVGKDVHRRDTQVEVRGQHHELVLSFNHLVPGRRTLVIRFGGKYFIGRAALLALSLKY